MTKQRPNSKDVDYEQLGHMLANIYESGYADKNKAYKFSFIKGVLSGLGGVIGATVVVAVLAWVLSLFDQVPLIGRLIDTIRHTAQ